MTNKRLEQVNRLHCIKAAIQANNTLPLESQETWEQIGTRFGVCWQYVGHVANKMGIYAIGRRALRIRRK